LGDAHGHQAAPGEVSGVNHLRGEHGTRAKIIHLVPAALGISGKAGSKGLVAEHEQCPARRVASQVDAEHCEGFSLGAGHGG
jgi:hypothetical protein